MTVRRAWVGLALALSLVIAFGGFALFTGPLRDVETGLVLGLLGYDRVSVVGDHVFQVLPSDADAFRASLTPFCSALIPILALAAIALCVLRGSPVRRVSAFVLAAAVVLTGNVLRIAGSLWVGIQAGPSSLVLFHDWVGTLFALTYTLIGFFFMLWVILPNAKARMPRAARVSDVL
ncbi:MAG: exosortase/archaeosortase family protein [Actinomycetes bacterium]